MVSDSVFLRDNLTKLGLLNNDDEEEESFNGRNRVLTFADDEEDDEVASICDKLRSKGALTKADLAALSSLIAEMGGTSTCEEMEARVEEERLQVVQLQSHLQEQEQVISAALATIFPEQFSVEESHGEVLRTFAEKKRRGEESNG